MPPPGRRRIVALSPLSICLALILLFTSTASAAGSVLGLDFGTLNLKAALVKPGIPLEIVLTKDSKRKEAAAVAFKPNRDSNNNIVAELGTFPERAYGGDALALQGRFPGEVFPNLKPLLGLPGSESANDAVKAYKERYPAVQVEQIKELGTTLVKSSAFVDQEMPWSVEELLAMELVNIRQNSESMAGKGASVEDVVITVPAFYTADERRAIERAATLAGLDVNALITDGLAVGVDYAKSRTFPEVTKGEKPEYHLVFDMGAGSTTATLLRFQGKSVKDVGRFNKTVQEVAVVGTGWDRTLGGDSLTNVIVNDYITKFTTKSEASAQAIRSNGRAMSRLWKEAEKSRQVLSANTDTSSSFEELLPDTDFKTKMSRTDFEELAAAFADRVAEPINDALSAAKLEIKDITSIILHGGAVRTPFVQKKLEEIAGGSSKLRSNVNADESAVFGAAFKGAGLSPSFKVKEIRDSDIAGYAAGMTYTDGEKERKQTLFVATSPVGNGASTKQVTFKDKDDFSFSLYQQVGEVDRPVTRIETRNLTAGVKALKDKWGCEKDEIATKFSIKLSPINGLPEVLAGSVSCEVEGSGKGESLGDSVKDWLGFGKKKGDQEPLQDGEGDIEEVEAITSSSSSASDSSSSSASSSKVPEKPKKHTETIAVSFTISPQGNPQPSPEEMKRMSDRLAAFDRADRARFRREEALNVLESFTYYVRDFLSNIDYEPFSTKAQRDELSKLLTETRSFMEDPKAVTKATEESLKEKHKALRKLVDPVTSRRRESEGREEKVSLLRTSLDQTEKLVEMVRGQVQQAEKAQSSAEEFDASQTTSADSSTVTSPSSVDDDFADLEEPDFSSDADASTTTPEIVPKYSGASQFSPYTNLDLTEVTEAYEKAKAWLDEKVAAQAKLSSHDEPVLLVKDIESKANELSEVMKDLLYKKMKAPPKSSSSKSSKTKSSSKKSGKKAAASSSDGDEEVTSTSSGKPARITVNSEDEMPSEEEILEMVSAARASQSSSSSTREHVVDEL